MKCRPGVMQMMMDQMIEHPQKYEHMQPH